MLMNLTETSLALKPLSLEDKAIIDSLMYASDAKGCEDSFATLFMWQKMYDFRIYDFYERKVIYSAKQKLLYYPMGKPTKPELLKELFLSFKNADLLSEDTNFIYNIPPNYLAQFPEASEIFEIKSDLGDADYIYCVEKLIENSGAKLRKKRNHIKHFILACPNFTVQNIDKSNIALAKDFMCVQSRARDLYDEADAIALAFDNFNALGLSGVLMKCPCDSIAAAAILSPLGGGVFDVHFEKSTRDVEGASQMIVWQEAVAIKNLGGKLMNREQDMNEENLRKAKESLDPLFKHERQRAYLK